MATEDNVKKDSPLVKITKGSVKYSERAKAVLRSYLEKGVSYLTPESEKIAERQGETRKYLGGKDLTAYDFELGVEYEDPRYLKNPERLPENYQAPKLEGRAFLGYFEDKSLSNDAIAKYDNSGNRIDGLRDRKLKAHVHSHKNSEEDLYEGRTLRKLPKNYMRWVKLKGSDYFPVKKF